MKKKMQKKVENGEYEFCKICRINHNQGRRHNFFPRHTNSLSTIFSRFNDKLSFVKSSLKNPSLLSSSQASPDRFWCIFCDSDIVESGTAFVSGNAIKHLSSDDHLKNLRHFLWKYGGGFNKLDSFRITDTELATWEKKCKVLKKDAPSSSGICYGSSHGKSNDIQTNYEIINTCNRYNLQFLDSSISKDVMPLQYATNENYQVCHSDISEAGKVGSFLHDRGSYTPWASEHGLETGSLTCQSRQQALTSSTTNLLADSHVKTGVGENQSMAGREPVTKGSQILGQIPCRGLEDNKGNVHSGAPPPWLEGFEACNGNGQSRGPRANSAENKNRKTNKLNPERVGAAWAEKRKLELEMEKRGEILANDSNANWLPNFGGVWQSGSRKESMKEFKKQRPNVLKAESQAKSEIKINPYISKRMRRGTHDKS